MNKVTAIRRPPAGIKVPNPNGIHLLRGALDEIPMAERGNQIILRGVIDPASLADLKVDDYQRESLPLSALTKLWQALRSGESLPDIELGMRGQRFDSKGEEFWLQDDVYIIDGQQRRNAAMHILSIEPNLNVRIGAMIHFSTTREWERERFRILNLERARVSPNVLLRNMRHQSTAVLTLYGLTYNQPDFTLFERICWKQKQSAQELITARTLLAVVATLHTHRSPAFRYSINEIVPALDRQAAFVKLDRWRQNIVAFFEFVDQCWGLRNVNFRDLALQVRAGFLIQLALLLSDHINFWRDPKETELHIDPEWRDRFSTFPLHDPVVMQTISSAGNGYSGGTPTMLYTLFRDHLNKRKRSNQLRNRQDELAARAPKAFYDNGGDDSEDESELEYPQ